MNMPGQVGHYKPTNRQDLTWQDQARCRDYPLAEWDTATEIDQIAICRFIDGGCPVLVQCAFYAIDGPAIQGPKGTTVHGGLHPEELLDAQRRRRGQSEQPVTELELLRLTRNCGVKGCTRTHHAKGWCRPHYRQLARAEAS